MRSLGASLVLLAAAVAPALGAQGGASIAARIAAAPDGEVRMTYASRPKVCGDGGDFVAVGEAMTIYGSMESYGSWSGTRCAHGPARVALTVRDHEVVGLRPHVGGSWPATGATLDLGTVPAAEAAAYFMALAPRLGTSSRRNPLFAAALADSADITAGLLRLGRDETLARDTRRRAVHLVGVVGDGSAVAPLVELARSGAGISTSSEDVGPGDGVQSAAVSALATLDDDAGLPALMDLARHGEPGVRKAAVFWLGQSDQPRARALVRAVVDDEKETESVRGAAIFALGQGENQTAADGAFLRAAFDRLSSERLKDRVLMAVAQSRAEDGTRWLLDRARDEKQPIETRRKAVFWAGQGQARVADLTALYESVSERRLREHVIFVLSQRNDDAATDALMRIARQDPDHAMRGKALFWLAQKHDPRVTKLIADIVTR